MPVWNVLHGARCKYRTQKVVNKSPSGHHHTTLSSYIFATIRHVSTIGKKNLLSGNTFSMRSHNMVNFGLLTAEIHPVVWGTPANFNLFRVLAALLHGTTVLGVIQTLRRWTEGATYFPQGGRHVGHWPTYQLCILCRWKFVWSKDWSWYQWSHWAFTWWQVKAVFVCCEKLFKSSSKTSDWRKLVFMHSVWETLFVFGSLVLSYEYSQR